MINRCIVAVLGLLIIVLIILGIRGCVNKNKSNNNEVQVTVTASPTPTAESGSKNIDQNFYRDSCFLGNSFIDGMEIYNLVDGADYFAKVGLTVNQADTETTDNGTVPIIDELNSNKNYKKIFMMFGENELGWSNLDRFVSEYEALVDTAKKYQPDADIYLLSVTPVSAEVSDKAEDGLTNDNIVEINKLIKEVAEDKDVIYCDIFSAVANSKGELPASAASDGIHFDRSYYEKCLIYIQKNYENGAPSASPSAATSSSSGSSSDSSSSNSSDNSSSGSSKSDRSHVVL